MAVEAVVGYVDLPAPEPLGVRELPLEERGEGLEPGNALPPRLLPEVLERDVVDIRRRVGLSGELRSRRVAALFKEQRVDRLLALLDGVGSRCAKPCFAVT